MLSDEGGVGTGSSSVRRARSSRGCFLLAAVLRAGFALRGFAVRATVARFAGFRLDGLRPEVPLRLGRLPDRADLPGRAERVVLPRLTGFLLGLRAIACLPFETLTVCR